MQMKSEGIRTMYEEEYEYLDFIKRSGRMNQSNLYGLEEGRTVRHHKLLRKYRFPVDKNKVLYIRSKALMANLEVMIDLDLDTRVTKEECEKLAAWLKSVEFKDFMDGRSEGLLCKGYRYS